MAISRSTPRSASRSNPPNASWDIYYGMYLSAILDSSRKGGNSFLFVNNKGSKQSVSIVQSCQMYPPLTPPTTLKHPHMTITNFNYESSYLPGVIGNIFVKADLGKWTPLGNTAEMPWIPVHQNWQMNLLWPMDPLPKCIMGYISWNVFGSHFRFFKKRWEFPVISE